jgi:ABC-type uncharacterized transport system auxiliary subunit
MRYILAILLVAVFVGCTTTYPPVTEYRIEALPKRVNFKQSSCKAHSLKVSQVFVKSALMSKKMKYVVNAYEEYAYNQSEWAEDPNKAITDVLVSDLEQTGIFDTVTSYKSFSSSDYTLECRIADFTQYFTENEKHSFVKIAMTFTLIDNKTAKVIATKTIQDKMDTKQADAKSGVVALNRLLQKSLVSLNSWLAGSCR